MLKRWPWMAIVALVFALSQAGAALAQPAPSPDALAAARELVATMRGADQLKTVLPLFMQQLKPAIVQGRPEVDRDYDAMLPVMMEIINARSAALIEEIAALYARTFTGDEMRQVTAFYRTPIGQKFLDQMPALMQESMTIGNTFGQAIAAELRDRMIEELRKRGHKL
jgi:hypothetical protein